MWLAVICHSALKSLVSVKSSSTREHPLWTIVRAESFLTNSSALIGQAFLCSLPSPAPLSWEVKFIPSPCLCIFIYNMVSTRLCTYSPKRLSPKGDSSASRHTRPRAGNICYPEDQWPAGNQWTQSVEIKWKAVGLGVSRRYLFKMLPLVTFLAFKIKTCRPTQ